MNTEPTNRETRLLFWQHLQQLVLMSLFHKYIRLNKIMELLRIELAKPGLLIFVLSFDLKYVLVI